MKYRPKKIDGNVNVSDIHPLKEFALLAGGILTVVVLLYALLGPLVDFGAPWLPAGLERAIGDSFKLPIGEDGREEYLAALSEELRKKAPADPGPLIVGVIGSEEENAFVVPGGRIFFYSGLLDKAATENEVAMVLAHEMGHQANRDHIRSLGRGLILVSLGSLVMGEEEAVDSFIGGALTIESLKYSRAQEEAADRFALETLVARYGNANGATEFFERAARRGGTPPEFLATHPDPQSRIQTLHKIIEDKGYSSGEPVPLPDGWIKTRSKADNQKP
jgi:Zn-dependent protease with chaperone function